MDRVLDIVEVQESLFWEQDWIFVSKNDKMGSVSQQDAIKTGGRVLRYVCLIRSNLNISHLSFTDTRNAKPIMSGQALLASLVLLGGLQLGTATPLGAGNDLQKRQGGCEQQYTEHEDKVRGSYIVNLTLPYTLQDHFDFLQEKFDVTELNTGYFADLTDEQLAKVRTDCSVQFVEDDTHGPTHEEEPLIEEPARRVRRGEQPDAPWPLVWQSAKDKQDSESPTESKYYCKCGTQLTLSLD